MFLNVTPGMIVSSEKCLQLPVLLNQSEIQSSMLVDGGCACA